MGLLDFLFKPKPKRRAGRGRRLTAAEREQRRIDREAAAWVRRDNMMRKTEAISILMREGMTEAQARRKLAAGRRSVRRRENPQRLSLALDFLEGRGHHARHNPTCGTCRSNPSAAEASEIFHGSPKYTKGGKVVVGELTRINYKVPPGSKRAGSEWTHKAGDRGIPFLENHGRAKVLADPNTGQVSVETRGSGMKFSPARGLVG